MRLFKKIIIFFFSLSSRSVFTVREKLRFRLLAMHMRDFFAFLFTFEARHSTCLFFQRNGLASSGTAHLADGCDESRTCLSTSRHVLVLCTRKKHNAHAQLCCLRSDHCAGLKPFKAFHLKKKCAKYKCGYCDFSLFRKKKKWRNSKHKALVTVVEIPNVMQLAVCIISSDGTTEFISTYIF